MAITTLTLPNGVRIETTADLAEVGHLLGSAAPTVAPAAPAEQPQPKAASQQPQPQPKADKPKRTKRTKSDGKALWAAITKAVAEGNYDEARRLAAPKPDTFGVQTEAAIARHQARAAKRAKATKSPKSQQPKAEQQPKQDAPKEQPKRKSALPKKGEQVEVKRVTPKAMAEAIDAKVRKSHKPDCGCVTCPKGIEARRAKAAAKAAAKADQPKAEQQPKPKQPKAEQQAEQEAAAMQREAERILAKSLEQAESLARALDLAGLKEATRQCLVLANRNERLGRPSLYEAYKDAADLFQDALTEAQAQMLA